jgi:antitoxin HicB
MAEKSIEYYMSLPYRVEVYPEGEGKGFSALIPDLPGCMTSAASREELWPMLEEAKQLWLEVALEDGITIPEPKSLEEEEYSGRFVLRLAKTLHRQLVGRAEEEGVSLNTLIVSLIGQSMGEWYGKRRILKAYIENYLTSVEFGPFTWDDVFGKFEKQPSEEGKHPAWRAEVKPIRQLMERGVDYVA